MNRIGTNWLLYQKEIDCVVVDVCEGVPMTAFSCFSSTSQFNNMLLIVLFAYAERPAEQLLVNALRLCSLSASGNTNNVDFGSILFSEKNNSSVQRKQNPRVGYHGASTVPRSFADSMSKGRCTAATQPTSITIEALGAIKN